MAKNKNPANSFSLEEIHFMRQLFRQLLQGRDVQVLFRCKSFTSVYNKFKHMEEKLDNSKA